VSLRLQSDDYLAMMAQLAIAGGVPTTTKELMDLAGEFGRRGYRVTEDRIIRVAADRAMASGKMLSGGFSEDEYGEET